MYSNSVDSKNSLIFEDFVDHDYEDIEVNLHSNFALPQTADIKMEKQLPSKHSYSPSFLQAPSDPFSTKQPYDFSKSASIMFANELCSGGEQHENIYCEPIYELNQNNCLCGLNAGRNESLKDNKQDEATNYKKNTFVILVMLNILFVTCILCFFLIFL